MRPHSRRVSTPSQGLVARLTDPFGPGRMMIAIAEALRSVGGSGERVDTPRPRDVSNGPPDAVAFRALPGGISQNSVRLCQSASRSRGRHFPPVKPQTSEVAAVTHG